MEVALSGRRLLAALVIAGSGLGAGQGLAQEDLNRGKTPAQLFASDCVDCHKNPRALGNRDNPGPLSDFLRVHYTASRESASAIAAYLVSLGPEPRAARPAGAAARPRPAAAQESNKESNKEPGKESNKESSKDSSKSAPADEPAKPAEAAPAKPAEPAPEKAAPPAAEPAPAAPATPAAPPADPK